MPMMDEMVLPVRPMSLVETINLAEGFLQQHFPEMLVCPQPLNVVRLVDEVLPSEGIRVYPVADLPDYGVTQFAVADDSVEILLRENLYDALFNPNDSNRVFAISTLVHETGHGLKHMPQFLSAHRQAKATGCRPNVHHVLHRRANLKAYEDPEWQAHAIGGALVAPPSAIRMLPRHSVAELAGVFGVSVLNMKAHMKRLVSKGLVTMRPLAKGGPCSGG